MAKIVVIAEHRDGKLSEGTLELCKVAKELASGLGAEPADLVRPGCGLRAVFPRETLGLAAGCERQRHGLHALGPAHRDGAERPPRVHLGRHGGLRHAGRDQRGNDGGRADHHD